MVTLTISRRREGRNQKETKGLKGSEKGGRDGLKKGEKEGAETSM